MSYGHGIVVTQLQMAYALNAVMNGGILYRPLIVEKICDADGNIVEQFEPEAKRRVISQEVSAKLRKMLKDTVERGTGIPAAIPGYDIGGKTGTAKYSGGKGYEPGKYVSSFVGIYPTKQPKYLALITIAKPKGKIYGGQVGAPVFRETFKKIFLYKNIRPESETDEFVYLDGVEKRNIESKEGKIKQSNKTLKENSIKDVKVVEDKDVMPNLKGLRIAEAVDILDKFNIDIETIGRGIIVDQNPKPGKDMKDVKKVEIRLEEKNSGK
jgi:cell division protein FtsI (penicillin-binding protein 3)